MTQRIAVLGDVHGNGRALAAALEKARAGAPDRIVFLGDLLTYGHDVDAVFDLVGEAQSRDGAELLLGNHDRMYFDLEAGKTAYLDSLPEWLRQSVALTRSHARTASLERSFRWSSEVHLDERALVTHANPMGKEDWRYLNSRDDHAAAADALLARSLDFGVFGHTHRPKWFDTVDGLRVPELDVPFQAPRPGRAHVVNAGAVGQPRDSSGRAVLLRLTLSATAFEAVIESVPYDLDAHLADLRSAALPPATVERLVGFFRRT